MCLKKAKVATEKWESASDYGKRATKLHTKLLTKLLDLDDESWPIKCFINGIYSASRRRRVRSQFQKTGKNFVSLRKTIDDLRHWRRLPKEYAYDSDSESNGDTTSDDESDSHSDIPFRPHAYVLVETISPEILSDAQVFAKFFEKNNLIPRYLSSGPFSSESIAQLQMPGQPEPPVETEPTDQMVTTAQMEATDQMEAAGQMEAADQMEATNHIEATNQMETTDGTEACLGSNHPPRTRSATSGMYPSLLPTLKCSWALASSRSRSIDRHTRHGWRRGREMYDGGGGLSFSMLTWYKR